MASIYESFLNAPSASALTPNASLHYITTTTSIHEATAIIKHIQAQDKLVKKKSETIISKIASGNSIVLETENSYEFVRGGGALLPQMDDNMLVDSLVTLPMVHIVQLDSNGKISQIRIHWDQGTMLRQVDAIGRTGRNWPIREGKAMAQLIKSSVSASGNDGPAQPFSAPPSDKPSEAAVSSRPTSSREKENADYQSRLFATGDDSERTSVNHGAGHAIRTSARPAPRQWDQIFPDENSQQKQQFVKIEGSNPRAGAGSNFGQNRLFDKNAATSTKSPSPERKHDAKHFNHFEFGNGEEAPAADANRPLTANSKKHMNNWEFEDFTTPPKVTAKPQMEQERHFGYGIDEDEPPTPARRPIVHAARPTSGANFAMADESPVNERHPPKTTRPDALASHLKSENGVLTAVENIKQPLQPITNVNANRRGQDQNFNIHYTSTDASPGASTNENARIDDGRQGGRNTRSSARTENEKSHWNMDETPEKVGKIYKTAGDGMGGRKDASREWMIGGEEPDVKQAKIYKTYGNGMGGRRDAAPQWSWGDRDDQLEEQNMPRVNPPRAKRTSSPRKRPRNFSEDMHENDDAVAGRGHDSDMMGAGETQMRLGKPPA